MPFLAWLLSSVALNVVGYMLLRQDPPKAPDYDDFETPTADANRPAPYVFGTVEVTGANILWIGDKRVNKQDGKSGGLFSKPRAPAVHFNCGVIFGLCYGPIDALLGVKMKDKVIFPPSQVESNKRDVTIISGGLLGSVIGPGVRASTRQDLDFVSSDLLDSTEDGEIIEGFPRISGISSKLNAQEDISSLITNGSEIKTSKAAIETDYPDLFGGKDMNGGVKGSILLTAGGWNQTLHDRTRQRIVSEDNGFPKSWREAGVPAPTFRGVATAHLSGDPGYYFGKNDPNMPALAFRIMRRPGAPFWKPAAESWHPDERETLMITPVGNDDDWRFPAANPAAVIYELMTNRDIGAAYAADEMDLDAYIHAARILSREKLGISGQWTVSAPIKELVKKICELIDGVTFTDPVTGLETIRLLRPEASLVVLPATGLYDASSRWHHDRFTTRRTDFVLHEGNAAVLQVNQSAYSDTVTHYHVKYTHDVTGQDGVGVTEVDEGALGRKLGIMKEEERDASFVRSSVIARRIARREMRNKERPAVTAKLRVGPAARSLRPYDVITLAFRDGSVPVGNYRVAKVPYGGTDGDSLVLELVSDVFSGNVVLGPDKPNVVWTGGSTKLVLSANGPYVTFATARALREAGMTAGQIRSMDEVVVSHLLSSPAPTSYWRASQRDGGSGADWDDLPGADLTPVSAARLSRRYPTETVTIFDPADLAFDRNAGSGLNPGSRILFVRPLRLSEDPWTIVRPSGSGPVSAGYSMSSRGAPQDAVSGAAMAMDANRKDEGEPGWQYREELCVITSVGENGEITVNRGLYGTTPAPLPADTAAYLLPDKDAMYSVREAEEGFQVSGRYTPVNAAGRGVLNVESSGVTAEPRHDFPERPGLLTISAGGASATLGHRVEIEEPAAVTVTWRNRNAFLNRPYFSDEDDAQEGVRTFVRLWRRVTVEAPGAGARVKAVCVYEARGIEGVSHVIPVSEISAAAGPGWNPGGLTSDLPDYLGAAMVVEVGSHIGDRNSLFNPIALLDVGREYPGYGDAYGYSYGGPDRGAAEP